MVSPASRWGVPFRNSQALEEPIMKPELYERVALRRDVNEHSLKKGDVALLMTEFLTLPAANRA